MSGMNDSGFGEHRLKLSQGAGEPDKENTSPPNKKARKSLAANWAPQDLCRPEETSLTHPETPSKSLAGDSSMSFTPPSILKNTLGGADDVRSLGSAEKELHESRSQYSANCGLMHGHSSVGAGSVGDASGTEHQQHHRSSGSSVHNMSLSVLDSSNLSSTSPEPNSKVRQMIFAEWESLDV